MDLLSLPNEMLASVLKYLKHESLQKLRSMNSRIDAIAKKDNLDKLVIEHLTLRFERRIERTSDDEQIHTKYFHIYMETKRDFYNGKKESKNFTIKIEQLGGSADIINGILVKYQPLKKRKIENLTLRMLIINEDTINIIMKYAKVLRNASLVFDRCLLQISSEKLKNFANNLNLSSIHINWCGLQDSLTDEVVIGFNPTMNVILYGLTSTSLITAKSLFGRVNNNRLNLEIPRTETSITFSNVVQFLKKFKLIEKRIQFGPVCDVPEDDAEIAKILKLEFGTQVLNCQKKVFTILDQQVQYGELIVSIRSTEIRISKTGEVSAHIGIILEPN